MKKIEKNTSTERTICTRSLTSLATATRKSQRLAPSPASVMKKSGRVEKRSTPSPLRRSERGKNISSQNAKRSDHSSKNAATNSDTEQRTDKKDISVQESENRMKKREPVMSARSYRALFRGKLKDSEVLVDASPNDEELVVVGCSRRVPAGNEDAGDGNTDCSPPANSESKRLPVGETSLEKGTDLPLESIWDTQKMVVDVSPAAEAGFDIVIGLPSAGNEDARDGNTDCSPPANSISKSLPVGETSSEKGPDLPLKSIRDTEKVVLDASPMVETGNGSVIGLPSENSEQKLLVSKTSLEIDIDLPLKRKRDTEGTVLDACATVINGDDSVTSSDGVIPAPSGCINSNKLETCSICENQQKSVGDFQDLSVCSCSAQPVEESDHVAQDTKESGPAIDRDHEENRQMYPEYWLPVQLSNVQLEQYCRTLLSKSLSLSSLLKDDLGSLEETLNSVRKTCDHPYVMDVSLKQLLTKNLELHEMLDVEVKASGKLHLLDAMLTHIKKNGLKAVVFYQATQSPEGLLLGNILEDFVAHRFGKNSYEHGIYSANKKNAINNFNKEDQCCVLLLETRACSQSIKLLRAEAFILFGSSWNPSHDVKHLEKIKIESYSEKTKIFRLYSVCTVEEKALILARQNKWQNKRQNKLVENLNRTLTHALLIWGASYLFDKLDNFHSSETSNSRVPVDQSIMDGVIHEFSSVLSSKDGEENESKQCLLLKAKHAQGTYSTDSMLFGEEHFKLSDGDSPNIFWTKLLGGKNPMWRYSSGTPQRSRKRVQYFEGSEESLKIGDSGNMKKRKKASGNVTDPLVDNDERNASGKDQMGASDSPKVVALQSSCKSTSGTHGTFDGNNAFGLYSIGGHISGIPEDMLAGHDWRNIPRESQRRLHAVLKPDMAKLCQVLQLSEAWTSMVEKILEYVIENHRIYEEPATTFQAFQIALIWIAAFLVKKKFSRKEFLVHAKSELAFNCSREEINYIYSIFYCMKSLFLERALGLQLDRFGTYSKQSMVSTKQVNESLVGATVHQEKNNTKLTHSSEGEECTTEKRVSLYSTATIDIEKTITDIKRKCKKKVQKLVQEHEKKKVELAKMYADKKQELEKIKRLEAAVIRITCSGTSTRVEDLRRLDHEYERKFDEIKSEKVECLRSLEQMYEAAKKTLAEDEACWNSRIKNWAQAELKICVPIKRGNNKDFSGICSSNTSKNAPGVLTSNDANVEATYADTNCMASKGNQGPEAENTLGTMPGGSTQQVHEMVASRNDKAMDVSTLSPEQASDNVATKTQSSEHTSITVPEILIPAVQEFAALNVHLSEYKNCGRITSVSPAEDVSPSVPEISQTVNLAKSASPEFSLDTEEALVTIENNRMSHVGPDADNILAQQNKKVCSLDKEIPDESALPRPLPASVVETRLSTESDQDYQDICPMPSSPTGKQLDPTANLQGQNIYAAVEPQSAGSETVETAGFNASYQGDQVTCSLPSSLAGNQPDPAVNVEGQNIETSAEAHIAGPDAMESGDSVVLDQEAVDAQDACYPKTSALVGTQTDLTENIEGQHITAMAQLQTAGSNARETGGPSVSVQSVRYASPLPFSSPGNHTDAAVNTEGPNNTTVDEPHRTRSDACEMEIAESGTLVEQSTLANLFHEGGIEPSAGVTIPLPSLLTNGMGMSAVQPDPQIPFPVFNDPFQYELEKLRRESETTKKTFEEKKLILKAELERKMAEVQAEYQRKFNEVEAEHNTRTMEIETNKNLVFMNKLLANAFLSKCTDKKASHASLAPRGRIQQLAQRAAQVTALRNYTAPAPAPLQPQASSFPSVPRSSSVRLHPALRPMPQPRQPLISNTVPTPSTSPATTPDVNASVRSHAQLLNSYRPSSSIPMATATPTSTSLPQPITYSAVLIHQQRQEQQLQQRLSNGLQGGNDVVCLSDDE